MSERATVASSSESLDHPYSIVRMLPDGSGYLSGVLPYEPDGSMAQSGPRAVERVIAILAERLATVGLGLDSVVRTTVYLTRIEWRDLVNEAWFDAFRSPRPARTVIEVRALPRGAPIEVDAVVHRDACQSPTLPV